MTPSIARVEVVVVVVVVEGDREGEGQEEGQVGGVQARYGVQGRGLARGAEDFHEFAVHSGACFLAMSQDLFHYPMY